MIQPMYNQMPQMFNTQPHYVPQSQGFIQSNLKNKKKKKRSKQNIQYISSSSYDDSFEQESQHSSQLSENSGMIQEKMSRSQKDRKASKSQKKLAKNDKNKSSTQKEQTQRDLIYLETMRRIKDLEQTSVYEEIEPLSSKVIRRVIGLGSKLKSQDIKSNKHLQTGENPGLNSSSNKLTGIKSYGARREEVGYHVDYKGDHSVNYCSEQNYFDETLWNGDDQEFILNKKGGFEGTFAANADSKDYERDSISVGQLNFNFGELKNDSIIKIVDSKNNSPTKKAKDSHTAKRDMYYSKNQHSIPLDTQTEIERQLSLEREREQIKQYNSLMSKLSDKFESNLSKLNSQTNQLDSQYYNSQSGGHLSEYNLHGNKQSKDQNTLSVMDHQVKEMIETIKDTYQDSDMTQTPYSDIDYAQNEKFENNKSNDQDLHYLNYTKPLQLLNELNGPSLAEIFNKKKQEMKNRLENAKENRDKKKSELSSRFKADLSREKSKSSFNQMDMMPKSKKTIKKQPRAKSSTQNPKKKRAVITKEESKIKEKSMINSKTPTKMSKTTMSLMDRLIKGDKPNLTPKEMIDESKRRYNELPEIKKMLETKIKKNQFCQRQMKVKEFNENVRDNLSRSASKNASYDKRRHVESSSIDIFDKM